MQLPWPDVIRQLFSEEAAFVVSISILVLGVLLAYGVWRYTHTLMREAGVEDAVEGTPFDRTAQRFGTSTVGIVATLSAIFVYSGAVILALNVSQLFEDISFWAQFITFLPNLFAAVFALIIGLIVGDKASLSISEKLRSVKLPQTELLPKLAKYSIFYLAALVALGQLGIATGALLILLAAYAFGLVFLCGLAFKNLLSAGAAGLYLLLTQPYTIGDEIRIDDQRGIVQEVDMFVTHIESDEEEYIVPNNEVFSTGIVRVRQ